MKKANIKRLSKAFRALANPNRLQLFLNLWDESRLDLAKGRMHECFLVNLLKGLRVGASTVSHHVRELENAGLIDTEKAGKQLIVAVNPKMLDELRALFQNLN